MSAHRQHAFDIPPQPIEQFAHDEPASRRQHLIVTMAVIAVLLIGCIVIVFARNPGVAVDVTPIPQPAIATTPLATLSDEHAQLVQLRLELFRAGYEAAVENGCRLQPLLHPPIGSPR